MPTHEEGKLGVQDRAHQALVQRRGSADHGLRGHDALQHHGHDAAERQQGVHDEELVHLVRRVDALRLQQHELLRLVAQPEHDDKLPARHQGGEGGEGRRRSNQHHGRRTLTRLPSMTSVPNSTATTAHIDTAWK